jgi:hypothetical protein
VRFTFYDSCPDIFDLRETEQLAQSIQKAMEQPFIVERLQVVMHFNVGVVRLRRCTRLLSEQTIIGHRF